ncbi:MAG: protein kinase [Phycisphaeraceae bacterium]|nr:protein kinase [Phycisphaeraceae bacterium]
MVRRIFDGAVELPVDQREIFIRESSGGDPVVQASVRELISEVGFEIDEFLTSRFGHPRIGTTLESGEGGWRLMELVGEGGGSLVFRAEWSGSSDRTDGRSAAIKILDSRRSGSNQRDRFRTEIETLKRLDHPGIVRAFDSNLDDDGSSPTLPWIAMEMVPDPRWITDLTLNATSNDPNDSNDPRNALHFLVEACDAIAQAHARGIVHRDIKPSNLLVGSDRRVRVIDFGIAHLQNDLHESIMHRTLEGALLGTPAYMAPEQVDVSLGLVSPRTDVYALGVVAFRMIAGRAPYEIGDNLLAAVQAIRHVPPLDLRRIAPGTPEALIEVIGRALSKDPEGRQSDASVLASEIRAVTSRRTSSLVVRRRKRSRMLIRMAVAMLVIGALIGVLVPFDRVDPVDSRPVVITIPDDVASIQTAITRIGDGGRILVRPGTYEENLRIDSGRSFTLQSTEGPGSTIVRSVIAERSVLRVGNGVGSETRIEGFTFTGGTTGTRAPAGFWVGGGLYLHNNAAHLVDCVFDGNRSTFGGNLYAMNFDGCLERCVFVGGQADAEGGNAMFFRGAAKMIDCDFIDGKTPGNGGGVKAISGWNRFCGCRFVGNRGDRGGGIIHVEFNREPSTLHVEESLIAGNRAFEGGGIWGRSTNAGLVLDGTVIRSNDPDGIGGPLNTALGDRGQDCWGDLDGDGMVDGHDIDSLLNRFGPVDETVVGIFDLNGDGSTDFEDLNVLLDAWGPCRF